MERAAVLCKGDTVGPSLIRSFLPTEVTPTRTHLNLDQAVAELERQMIRDALAATADNKHAAAQLLGIGERTLWTKLKKHGI